MNTSAIRRSVALSVFATALMASTSVLAAATVLPSNGKFVAGTGSISATANNTVISQSSQLGIVNWNSFSIGAGGSVFFNNGRGATLSRVTGGSGSQIDGSLGATGSVFLINTNGIVIGAHGQVVTNGSFVASTRDISNSTFLAGGAYNFAGTSGSGVTNEGSIISNGGDVVLIGQSVTNSGTISAANGTAGLAAGNNVVLQPVDGDQRIAVSGGSGSVTNTGTVSAAAAELAAADGNVYALAGNNGGIVRATGTQAVGGHVWLTAGGGTVQVTGTVSATNANGSGGAVTVRGSNIAVTGLVSASASAAGASGGDVSIVASNSTSVAGKISAAGGANGEGGAIETSGRTLSISGASVNAGSRGSWLLDPENLTLDSGAATIIQATLNSGSNVIVQTESTPPTVQQGSGTPSSSIGTASAGAGDIDVTAAIKWTSLATLTLDAYHSINISAPITVAGDGGLILNTGNGGSLGFGLASNGFAGSISYTGGASSGATLSINGQAYTLIYTIAQLQGLPSSGYYALAGDLSANSSWTPIGEFDPAGTGFGPSSYTAFTGTLEGLGNSVSLSSITFSEGNFFSITQYEGLFGELGSGGVIRDVGMTGSLTGTGNSYIGALVGYNNGGTITNSFSAANVTGSGPGTGGLIGFDQGTVTGSASSGTINGDGNVGGLVGLEEGVLDNSSSSATVSGSAFVGGLVGVLAYPGSGVVQVAGSSASGAVSGTDYVGGLVGYVHGSTTIYQSYATGAVTGSGGSFAVGGLVGQNGGGISQAYSTGLVTTLGDATSGGVGGLVGVNSGGIEEAYSASTITGGGTDNGGVVGYNSGSVDQTYFTGLKVVGASNTGAVIGDNEGTVTNSYWASDVVADVGSQVGTGSSSGMSGFTSSSQWGTLPSGFNSGVWSTAAKVLPYFSWQPAAQVSYVIEDLTPNPSRAGSYETVATYGSVSTSYPAIILDGIMPGDGVVGAVTLLTNSAGQLAVVPLTSASAGTYAEGATLTGAGSKYSIATTGITYGTMVIDPATLTVTPNSGATKVYGQADPTFGYSVSTFTDPDGDAQPTFTGALSRASGSNVGSYAITLGGLSAGKDFTLDLSGTVVDFHITPATLDVTPNALSMSYGAAVPTLTYTYSGLVNRDTSSVFTGALSTTASSSANVGTYPITIGSLSAGSNYSISLTACPACLTINADVLDVTANALSMEYGATVPTLTYSYTNSDNVKGYTSTAPLAFTGSLAAAGASSSSSAGSKYAITAGTLSAGSNYTVDFLSTGASTKYLTVTPDVLDVTPTSGLTKVYGQVDPTLTYTYIGTTPAVPTFTGTLSRVAGSSVGNYAISQGTLTAGSNFTIDLSSVNFSITPATLDVTATPTTVAQGEAIPALPYSYSGLVNGDTKSVFTGALATIATASSPTGHYAITQGTLSAGNNYTIDYTACPSCLTIATANLEVIAKPEVMTYGGTVPTLAYTYELLPGGSGTPTFSGSLATAATAYSNVGLYPITLGTLSAGSSYVIDYVGANLTINAAILDVTANALSVSVGAAIPTLTYGVTGLVDGELANNVLTGALTTSATSHSAVGKYAITEGTLGLATPYASDYTIYFTGNYLTVQPATPTPSGLWGL